MGQNLNIDNNEDEDILGAREPLQAVVDNAHPEHETVKQNLREIIFARGQNGKKWGWKDTLTAQYLPAIYDLLENPKIIAVFRDFSAIASREYIETGRSHMETLERAQRNYANVLDCLRLLPAPKMVVSYDKALRNPIEVVTAIAQFTQAPISEDDIPRIANYLRPEAGSGQVDDYDKNLDSGRK